MNEVLTFEEVAKHFKIKKPHTVGKWAKAGCPALQSPPYDLEAVKEWRAYRVHGKKTDPKKLDDGLARRKLQAQLRRHEVETELKALTLAEKRRELIAASDLEEIVSKQSLTFRTELLSFPRAIAHLLVELETPELVEAKLAEEVKKLLSRLSLKYLEATKEGG